MLSQAQAFKQYLKNREEAIELERIQDADRSHLYNEKNFYKAFVGDLLSAKREIVIYSPFITKFRANYYKRIFESIRRRNVEVFIFTRPIDTYDSMIQPHVEHILKWLDELGVCVFFPGKYIHEKIAIIDREILWEGSLNILSHKAGNEIMRRTKSERSALEILNHLNLNSKLAEGYKTKYEKIYRSFIGFSRKDSKQNIRIFLAGVFFPIIIWWIFSAVKGMMPLLRLIFILFK